jgi:serine/threonine protein kinase
VDHPNVIKLREVFFGSRTVYLVMELCQGGELFDEITHNAQRGLGEVSYQQISYLLSYCTQLYFPTSHDTGIRTGTDSLSVHCGLRVMPQS